MCGNEKAAGISLLLYEDFKFLMPYKLFYRCYQFGAGIRFFGCYGFRIPASVHYIKDGRANENREEEGDKIHSEAKEERVPASNGRQCGFRFHGYYFSFSRVSAGFPNWNHTNRGLKDLKISHTIKVCKRKTTL